MPLLLRKKSVAVVYIAMRPGQHALVLSGPFFGSSRIVQPAGVTCLEPLFLFQFEFFGSLPLFVEDFLCPFLRQ